LRKTPAGVSPASDDRAALATGADRARCGRTGGPFAPIWGFGSGRSHAGLIIRRLDACKSSLTIDLNAVEPRAPEAFARMDAARDEAEEL